MNRLLTSRLAAQGGTRAADVLVHSDHAGLTAAAVVNAAWRRLLDAIEPGVQHFAVNRQRAAEILGALAHELWAVLHVKLTGIVRQAHDGAADALMTTLPLDYLRSAGLARLHARTLQESELQEDQGQSHDFDITDLGALLRGPHTLTRQQEYELFRSLLFPAPSHQEVTGILDRILPTAAWLNDVGDEQQEHPMTLANMVASITAGGGTQRDVALALKPYFDGSMARATRTARTLGGYIGTERNLATSEALGDLVIGYQVHDAMGPTARPTHALRSGTIYYKRPGPGQWGMDVMPHPPIDTQRGPHDDMQAPRGVCFHCRCWLTPVLGSLPAMQTAAFTDNADRLIPDPAHFADWWQTATPPQKSAAAGVRRLALARSLLGREPEWADLVDPHTGQLLTLEQLRTEGEHDRMMRAGKVQAIVTRNRAAVKQTAAFGTA